MTPITQMKRLLLSLLLAVTPLAMNAQFAQGAPPASSYSFNIGAAPDPMEGGGAGGQVAPSAYGDRYFTRFAVSATASTLGTGGQLATNYSRRIDLRVTGNYLNYTYDFNQSNFNIGLNLGLTNTGVLVDYYPLKSFRISPGYLLFNTNRMRADLTAQQGATFTINNVTYVSDDADPIRGIGRLVLAGSGFMATAGWGRIVSKNRHHFTFPFEAGAAFIDTPRVYFNLQGAICEAEGYNCAEVYSYPGFASNLNAQLASWNKRVAPFHVYPLVQGGIAYTFRLRK
jgi:hypothetical protein